MISCAQQIIPSGGPQDETPPRIIRTWPENGTVNFNKQQVIFQFSEYVKSSNLSKDIFITPFQEPAPEMFFRGKRLYINWDKKLHANTTYVIQPGRGIKDVTESNEMDSLFQFAFSTGSFLDSCKIKGKVLDPLTGKGAEGLTLLLFHPDSVPGDSIFKKRPEYASITDSEGFFTLAYLARKPYRLYGVKEEDGNYQYNSTKEAIALARQAEIDFTDSTELQIDLLMFVPDAMPPRLISKVWITNQVLELEWNEAIRLQEESHMQIVLTDTFDTDTFPVQEIFQSTKNPEKIHIFMEDTITVPVHIHILNACDTLLNCIDTVPVLAARKSRYRYPLRMKREGTVLKDDTLRLRLTEPLPENYPDSAFVWIDTSGTKYPAMFIQHKTTLSFPTDSLPDKSIAWTLQSDSADLVSYSGNRADTVYHFVWNASDPDNYGAISGTVKDSLSAPIQNPLLRIEHAESGTVWYIPGNRFDFKAITPSELNILVIEDLDGNGRWTPGALHPYQMPERCYPLKNIPKIRAGWDLEDVKVELKD